jgi:hypothetical protein
LPVAPATGGLCRREVPLGILAHLVSSSALISLLVSLTLSSKLDLAFAQT